jgi:leader peptidase (prepilin peptidase)/N-methyltransferase
VIASLASAGILLAWVPLAIALAARGESRLAPQVGSSAWRAAVLPALAVVAVCCLRPAASAVPCGLATIGLVAAAFVDARTGYLPDTITAPVAALSALAAAAVGSAGAAVAGVLLLVGGFGALVGVSRGRLMGLGDVKAMYAIGAAFGPAEAVFAVGTACLSGIAAAAFSGRLRAGSELRFGPHLAVGCAIAVACGDRFVHGMLGL